jgi:hypothetical protein
MVFCGFVIGPLNFTKSQEKMLGPLRRLEVNFSPKMCLANCKKGHFLGEDTETADVERG